MNNSKEFYELNTHEFYAYGFEKEEWSYMNFEVLLRDDADPELLKKALELTYERYPYFKTMLSKEQNPGRIVLRRNPHPVKVFESDDYVEMTEPSLSGHLIAVSCSGRSVKVRVSHALTDGSGVKTFLKTMLTCYFRMKVDGETAEEIRCEMEPADVEKEYGNPFDNIRMPDYAYRVNQMESFAFSEDEVDDGARKSIRFSVPEGPILKFAKSQESSVAAVISWAVIRAVYEVQPTDLPVTVAVPFNTRGNLNCPETNRNCNTTTFLRLSRDYLKHDNEMQLTALRAQLYLQMDDGCAVPRMQSAYEGWLKACECKTVQERIDYYHSGDNLDFFPIVTYVGIIDLGEYEPYYEKIDCFVKVTGRAGALLCVLSNKGMIHFHVTSTVKNWETYQKVIHRMLQENRIPVTEPVIRNI